MDFILGLIPILLIIAVVWAAIYTVKKGNRAKLKKDQILEDWHVLIEGGRGCSEDVYETLISALKDAEAPGVTWERQEIEAGQILMRKSYDGIVITNSSLKGFTAYVFAYDYGTALHVTWFLAMKTGILLKSMTEKFLGTQDPKILIRYLPIFQQLELSAYSIVVHTATKKAVAALMGNLKQDFSSINTKSKGFLEVW
jgi:hypothetical protein